MFKKTYYMRILYKNSIGEQKASWHVRRFWFWQNPITWLNDFMDDLEVQTYSELDVVAFNRL